jgi:hypothetical protein
MLHRSQWNPHLIYIDLRFPLIKHAASMNTQCQISPIKVCFQLSIPL